MVTLLDDQCILCDEGHRVENFSKGPKDVDIVVVSKMKNSSTYQGLIEQQLSDLGLDTDTIYFTPVIKCRDYGMTLGNKRVREHAREYLIPELEEIKPKSILALGNEALLALTGKSGITKYRGRLYEGPAGSEVMATLSPSAIRRNPGQTPGYMADLRLFVNKYKGIATGIKPPKYSVIDTKEKLKKLTRLLQKTDEITIDIESWVPGGEYYEPTAQMVSLAATCEVKKKDGTKGVVNFALPLSHPESPWAKNWKQVLKIVGKSSKGIRKVVAHNSSFDCKWLIQHGVELYPTFDTMLAVHLLNENIQKGLKPQAMARLGVEPWGIDTGDLHKEKLSEVLKYNMLDSWYTYHIKQQLAEELKEKPRLARIFSLLTMPAQRELIDSELRGIWIDVERLNERHPVIKQRLVNVENRIRQAASLPEPHDEDYPKDAKGKPLAENYNASNFARWMLFDWCGLPVLQRGKDKEDGSPGSPSMSEGVLMELKGQHPVVDHMLDRVTIQKQLSGFFNPYQELYDENHRIHTTFKLAGTVTGRLSSGKQDADKLSGSVGKLRGVNLQQVPRDPFIRGMFGAPRGWTFVEADYSQIELRVAAFLANEEHMKHIYATGGDIHTTTASRVSGVPESKITKELRERGKPINFGFLYGMGWRTFVESAFKNYGVRFTETEAQQARELYFQLYPALLTWHARQRRLVNKYGRVESPLGRVRNLPDIYSPDKGVRGEAERQAINSPVQGFGSDLAVLSMVVINERFREKDIKGYCLGLVHDAINFEIKNEYLPQALPIIKDTMEDMSIVRQKFGTVVDIPIVADIAVGNWWGDSIELKESQVYNFIYDEVLGER